MSFDISVIIPTFNRLWCLPEAVASCRGSTCSVEIIVVDDGGNDGTWEWLQSQPDVVAIRKQNWGKDWAVNQAFAAARGEFVRFLDSDDSLPSGANDEQLAVARADRADIVAAGYIVWDDQTSARHEIEWTRCDDFVAQQLGECDSSHYSAYLFRREFIANIPHRQEFGVRDDRMFVIEVAVNSPRVSYVDKPALIHRRHERPRLQFQKGLPEAGMNWQHLQIYRKAAAILESRGELNDRRKKAIARALWPLAHWVAYTHLDDACDVVEWIFALDSDFRPPNVGALGTLYRSLGFRRTERLLKLRRSLVGLVGRTSVTPC